MNVKELSLALTKLMADMPNSANAPVTYGPDFEPVEGGIGALSKTSGNITLNLSPISLRDVGGF